MSVVNKMCSILRICTLQIAEGAQSTAVKCLSIGETKNSNIWDYFSSQNKRHCPLHRHKYCGDFQDKPIKSIILVLCHALLLNIDKQTKFYINSTDHETLYISTAAMVI